MWPRLQTAIESSHNDVSWPQMNSQHIFAQAGFDVLYATSESQ